MYGKYLHGSNYGWTCPPVTHWHHSSGGAKVGLGDSPPIVHFRVDSLYRRDSLLFFAIVLNLCTEMVSVIVLYLCTEALLY